MTTITDEDCIAAAFHDLSDERWEELTDDEHIVDFHGAARSLHAQLQAQLTDYNSSLANGGEKNPDWHHRIRAIAGRTAALNAYLGPKVKERNRRGVAETNHQKFNLLRRAIVEHQKATLAEYDPTPADNQLWAALVEAYAMGDDDA